MKCEICGTEDNMELVKFLEKNIGKNNFSTKNRHFCSKCIIKLWGKKDARL